jgi:hypothetical protein
MSVYEESVSEHKSAPIEHRVAVVHYGPVCGEYVAGGFEVMGTSYLPELQDLTTAGALVVIGGPIAGFQHLVDEARQKLPASHHVIYCQPCHSTQWFWDGHPSVEIDGIAQTNIVVEECVDTDRSLIRDALIKLEESSTT